MLTLIEKLPLAAGAKDTGGENPSNKSGLSDLMKKTQAVESLLRIEEPLKEK